MRPFPIASLLLLIPLTGCDDLTGDLQKLCDAAAEVLDDSYIPDEYRMQSLQQSFEAKGPSRAGRKALELSLQTYADYGKVVSLAEDAGASGWSCPALEHLLSVGDDPDGGGGGDDGDGKTGKQKG